MFEYARRMLEKTYTGKCNVYGTEVFTDENGITDEREGVLVKSNIPCFLSYSTNPAVIQGNYGVATSVIKLFLSPDIEIPLNSEIEVTQNGITKKYKHSGEIAMYRTHQEITLDSERKA